MIARHEIPNLDWALDDIEDFHQRLSAGIPVVVSSPAYLGNFGSEALRMGFASLALAKEGEKPLDELELALKFFTAHWSLAGKLLQQLELDVEGHSYQVIGGDIKNFVSFSNWLFAALLGRILRDDAALTSILQGGESFFGDQFKNLNDSERKEARFFVWTFGKDADDPTVLLEDWLNDSSGDGEAYRKMIKLPQGQLWRSVIAADKEKSESSLRQALESHKAFWGAKDMRQDKNGWISLPLLAACAYAYDHGMDLNVESDYIPRWLYMGEGIK